MSIKTSASHMFVCLCALQKLTAKVSEFRAQVHIGCLTAVLCVFVMLTPRLCSASEPMLYEAQSAVVIDADERVLWSKNSDAELGLASVTKVMCAMVALDSGKNLDETYTLQQFDTGANSQTAGYKAGDTATLRELLQVLLVFSANDAAEEIAYIVSGSEQAFVDLMNQKAQALGMIHTHFVNPHGLEEEGHYSSVLDMVAMGRYALACYPFIAKTVQMHSVEIKAGGQTFSVDSTDELVKSGYEGILGIKTGSIESGTTFLGAAERDGLRIYTAVLGCKTSEGRFADTQAMMDWVWENFHKKTLSQAGTILSWQPFRDNFLFKCPVYVETSETGWFQSDADPVTWQRTGKSIQALVEPGDTFALTNWSQGSRQIATVTTRVGTAYANIPAVSSFIMPLFAPVPKLAA